MTETPTKTVPAGVLRSLCALFMADDTPGDVVLRKGPGSDDERVREWLNAQAREHGFDDWVVAYHEIQS